MEPDDAGARPPADDHDLPAIPFQDLLGVGAEPDPGPPGPDDLRAIVARAGRRRLRVTAVGVAAALAVGAGVGYGVSNHGSPSVSTASSGASPTGSSSGLSSVSSGATAGPMATSPMYVGLPKLTSLFNRTTGGITIRGFLSQSPAPPMGALSRCTVFPIGPTFEAELSTAKMVGTVPGGYVPVSSRAPASGIESVMSQPIGVAEGDPTAVVVVQTSSAVANVRMAFAGGATDQMAPVRGWAALAAPAPAVAGPGKSGLEAVVGRLTAYNAAGGVLGSSSVTLGYNTFGTPGGPPRPLPAVMCGGCAPVLGPPAPKGTPGGVVPGGPLLPQSTTKGATARVSTAPVMPAIACPGVVPGQSGGTSSGGSSGSGSSTGVGSSGPPSTVNSGPATG